MVESLENIKFFLINISIIVLITFLFGATFSNKVFAQSSPGMWTQIALSGHKVSTLVSNPSNPNILYAGTDNGVYKSSDGGATWIPTSNQGVAAEIVVISPTNPNILYATLGTLGIQKSTNGGLSWTNITNNFGNPLSILDLAVDPTNSNIVYAAPYGNCLGVKKSIDGGNSWSGVGGGCDIYRIVIDSVDNNILYVGGTDFSGYFEKSSNGGNTWQYLNSGLVSPGAVYGISIDPHDSNVIYVGDENNGVYKTENGGISWGLLQNSPSVNIRYGLAINPLNSNIYAQSSSGVSESSDGGLTWQNINLGNIPTGIVRLVVLSNNLYALTTNGIYVYGLGSIPTLNVPLVKQGIIPFDDNYPVWEGNTFSNGGYQCGDTIAECGCALTSDAMVLKYFHVDKLPDASDLNPGTLNNWLINNHGYFRDEGVNPYIVATIAHKAKTLNSDFTWDALEYQRTQGYNPAQLTNDINDGIPDVLEEPGHYIVAKGVNGITFDINDPFYNRSDLSSYNNTFLSIGKFKPSNSDMSYIVIAINKDININVTDSDTNEVGQIYLQYHLNNPVLGITNSSPSLKIFSYAKPNSENYKIELSSDHEEQYQMDLYLITQDGEYRLDTFNGTITDGSKEIYALSYDKQNISGSTVRKGITIDTLINDIKSLSDQDQYKNNGVFTSLIVQANIAKADKVLPWIGTKLSSDMLERMKSRISMDMDRLMSENAYNLLVTDIDSLLSL